MELKTQALDRVLEALSPALAAELDRVVSETREALEQEFQKRLQSAVREAESASRQAAEAEQEQAVREARETTKNQVTEELNEQFKKTLEQATSALKSEASTELARVQEQLDQLLVGQRLHRIPHQRGGGRCDIRLGSSAHDIRLHARAGLKTSVRNLGGGYNFFRKVQPPRGFRAFCPGRVADTLPSGRG